MRIFRIDHENFEKSCVHRNFLVCWPYSSHVPFQLLVLPFLDLVGPDWKVDPKQKVGPIEKWALTERWAPIKR
jgi:hypothetical protein